MLGTPKALSTPIWRENLSRLPSMSGKWTISRKPNHITKMRVGSSETTREGLIDIED